ncbi:hypothetical protein DSM104299_03872 [Baekduia alba]|uniref:GH36-type glycosyl hydrolase domain-containing protein n=1 Tax=Baekduia alba TaxID=2997333 RepID=UPI002340EC49|nr:hypothetical protein [Baekduia alba]WCB95130.1 hypothetical protein DSM104299_03872 [Baekduia alba]
MTRRRLPLLLAAALGLLPAAAAAGSPALAAGPPPLSGDAGRAAISSPFGNGDFGRWVTDRFGLPAYDYTIDQHTNPIAAQQALAGGTDAWNQVGNGRVKVDAHTGGWIQFWDQDRLAQWGNRYEPDRRHYGGGYGFLRVGGRTISTAYDDRPAGARTLRRYGVGSFARRTVSAPVAIDETVYAPFGDDPAVRHDVRITNTTTKPINAVWSEYWDVNPVVLHNPKEEVQPQLVHRGMGAPRYAAATRTLSVAQRPFAGDEHPLSIFAAALGAPVDGHGTSAARFFGAGTRAQPTGAATRLRGAAGARPVANGKVGDTAFVLQSAVRLAPHRSVTLRYAYGMAQPRQVTGLVRRLGRVREPLRKSMDAWRRFVPQVSLGGRDAWVGREMQWDAYMVKAASVYDAICGVHTITQGGYYQYAIGFDEALRDPLEHMLPMTLLDPKLAKETIVWALQYQRAHTGDLPYGTGPLCGRVEKFGTADELSFWLELSVIQYVQQTRDFAFLDERVRYAGGGAGTVWQHLRLAYANQEKRIGYGPHGLYRPGTEGDTFDLTTPALHLTESTSTTGNFAYMYPQLAALATAHGDRAFAATLRADGARLARAVQAQWQARGWYARGYIGDRVFGTGAIYADAQYWPLMAGLPSAAQSAAIVGNVRRYLDDQGAPPQLRGPSPVGPLAVPAKGDPDITESTSNFPGSESWWFMNGPLVWGLAQKADAIPGAGAYAWDVFRRITLANHAETYPDQWSGIITTDDTCAGPSSPSPGRCGLGFSTAYNTQITHAHAWGLFDLFKLGGLDATPTGYRVSPRLPASSFSVRTKVAGVAYGARQARGYVRPVRGGTLAMQVRLPAPTAHPAVFVSGRRARFRRAGDVVTFTLRTRAGRATDWAVRTGS